MKNEHIILTTKRPPSDNLELNYLSKILNDKIKSTYENNINERHFSYYLNDCRLSIYISTYT